MKIACQSCQAKYTIADEKVLGRVVKIRCKKCGATIVINGNETGDAAGHASEEQTMAMPNSRAFDYAAPQTEEPWTVNVADGDQRTMTTADLVAQFKAGVVNDETYCWKDGMGDWLPLREIEQLASACGMGAEAHAQAPQYQAPAAAVGGGGLGALFGGGDAGAYAAPPPAETNGNGAGYGLAAAPAPAAARRAGGRAGGADLFGTAAEAGGENDVMTSAPQGSPAMHEGDSSKLTGQRNENSVLFSLNALTQNAPKEETPGPQGDGSGLIDIRALSATMAPQQKKSNHVDDIMNLGGGGAFSAALAAPVLAPPSADAGDVYGAPATEGGKNNKMVFILLGVVGLLVAALLVVLLLRKPETVAATPAGGTATAGSGTGPVAANDTATAPTPTSPPAADSAMGAATPPGPAPADPTKPSTASNSGTSSSGRRSSSGNSGGGAAAAPAAPVIPPSSGGGNSLDEMMKKAAGNSGGAAPPPPSTSSAQFDRGAAAGALGAVNVASCKKGDGPTGAGHVSVTFAPDGSVATAVVDQPPFAGTAVGGCVAGKFRGARVPAFAGGSVKVGKSFVIN